MACPPVSAPHCREDQFLVEVRGEKTCCYSYLCGKLLIVHTSDTKLYSEVFGVWLAVCYLSIYYTSINYSKKLNVLYVFLCEQCVSHALNQFQHVHMEKFWRWILTTPTAAVLSTIVVSLCV